MSKKKVVSFLIVGILSVGLIGGSFAWFTAKDNVINAFEIIGNDNTDDIESGVEIVEEFVKEDAKNMLPGTTVDKVVKVKNTANYNQFVRVKLDKVWKYNGKIVTHYIEKVETVSDSQGNPKKIKKYEYLTEEQASNNKRAISLDESLIVLNFNKDTVNNINNMKNKWSNVKDLGYDNGWFYYIGRIAPNDTTNILLDSVTLSLDTSIIYQGLNFDVIVTAQGIQDTDSALDDVWTEIPYLVKNAMIKN